MISEEGWGGGEVFKETACGAASVGVLQVHLVLSKLEIRKLTF